MACIKIESFIEEREEQTRKLFARVEEKLKEDGYNSMKDFFDVQNAKKALLNDRV